MTEAILTVRGLVRYFDARRTLLARLMGQKRYSVRAVDGLNLEIARGETLALVGESGCGKSTVARCVAGLMEPTAGSVSFSGRRLQMIFQDPYASLDPRWRVFEIVAEPIRAYRLTEGEHALSTRVGELLEQVGLTAADGRKYPHEFSGGQRQRISIARALASEPDFLICDEPTSSLDVSVQAQILNLMKDLQGSLGLTYLFITHNLAVVYQIADRIGVMYLGKLVETQSASELFARPRHPYTRMLLDAVPHLDGRRDRPPHVGGDLPSAAAPPSGCGFHPRCPLAFEPCSRQEPALIDGVACHAEAARRVSGNLGGN
jgi:peptide/nickel transport system ATP-binding protein